MTETQEVKLSLKLDQVHLLLMSIDAGLINFNNVQNVLSGVFQNKSNEEHTKKLMDEIGEVRKYIIEELKKAKEEKPKSTIIMP